MTEPNEPTWSHVADQAPKPYVHPLVSPGGRTLSRLSPPDHVWHRALWFAIKYVDGENFWEEDPPFGSQREVSPGRLEWVRPSGEVALVEERSVVPGALAETDVGHQGDQGDAFAIDWTTTLTAPAGAVLDRTPYTTWGGYGGLTLRGAADWADTRVLLADGTELNRPEGVPSPWCDLSSTEAGVTFLDHPSNPRHPVPWYGASRSWVYGEGWSNFLNAAFLFHEPMELGTGESLRLAYRVIVHDGAWGAERAQAAWDAWVG